MMTDDQFKAFLNTFMDGFNRTIEAIGKGGQDHDLLIRMDTKLEMALATMEKNQKEFLDHKAESVPVRDDIKWAKSELQVCKGECRSDMLKSHDGWIRGATWFLRAVGLVLIGIVINTVWANLRGR